MMNKLKIFHSTSAEQLENLYNEWRASNPHISIMDVQYEPVCVLQTVEHMFRTVMFTIAILYAETIKTQADVMLKNQELRDQFRERLGINKTDALIS